MLQIWKGRHPEGGTITSIRLNRAEASRLATMLPSNVETLMLERSAYPQLANELGIKTKYFALTIVKE